MRLAGSARVVIAAVSIGLGAAACGSANEPAGEQSDPPGVIDTSPSDTPSATGAPAATAGGSTTMTAVSQETIERTTTSITTASADTTLRTVAPEPGVSEAEVNELEQQLDEIDRMLADLEAQLSED